MDVSIVVVTYNAARYIGACLDALPAAVGRCRYEVVVVDNASADDTRALVRGHCPDALVVANRRNVGFARANNQAIALASGRHVLLLNPDTVASPGSVEAMARRLDQDGAIGAVAPSLRNPDGTDQRTARAFPTPAAAFLGRRSPLTRLAPGNRWSRRYLGSDRPPTNGAFAVDWVSGACVMVPRAVVDAVGPLDPGYFMYWEDADWCRRITAAGWSVVCEPAAVVVHDEGASRRRPARQVWYFHASAYRYYATHHLGGARAVLRPLVGAGMAARGVAVVGAGALAAGFTVRTDR